MKLLNLNPNSDWFDTLVVCAGYKLKFRPTRELLDEYSGGIMATCFSSCDISLGGSLKGGSA